jgi:hypothetical protein
MINNTSQDILLLFLPIDLYPSLKNISQTGEIGGHTGYEQNIYNRMP